MVLDVAKLIKENKELKKKKYKNSKDLLSKFNSKTVSKPITKKNKMEIHMNDREIESTWNDPNRFFKGQLRSMLE